MTSVCFQKLCVCVRFKVKPRFRFLTLWGIFAFKVLLEKNNYGFGVQIRTKCWLR